MTGNDKTTEVLKFEDLIGQTITKWEIGEDKESLTFHLGNGEQIEFYHEQDCCEHVSIEDIDTDLDAIVGRPLVMAESVSQKDENADESGTWTFYKFGTDQATVTVRWYGSSNGYYSESVHYRVFRDGQWNYSL